MSAYKLNEFLIDVSGVIVFGVVKSLRDAGYPDIDGDDYVNHGPQYMRRVFKLATENAQHLIKSGMPEEAFMSDVWEFLLINVEKHQDMPEIYNRENVIACVFLIKTYAKLND